MGSATPAVDQKSRKEDMLLAISSRQHFCSPSPLSHHVARSWERCLNDYELNPDRPPHPQQVSRYELEQRREENFAFLSIAATEVSNLYQQISGSGSAILLADKDGVTMNVVGDSRFLEKTQRKGFIEGAVWSERSCGTNGLGTCLVERTPVLVHQHDHFYANYSNLTCAAAPIFDYKGELLGVLDASSDSPLAQQYSVALVKMSAQMIENRVFLSSCAPHYLVRFHSRIEFVGALGEGVITFDTDGNVIAMNGTAQFQFDEDWQHGISQASIDDFFDTSIPQMLHKAHLHEHSILQLRCARSGRNFYASVHAPQQGSIGPDLHLPRTPKPETSSPRRQLHHTHNTALCLPIDCFEFGDTATRKALQVAEKTLRKRAAPLLICGETGTGKSTLAQSLHHSHMGSECPFIRINCASLREDSVENQLFGQNGSLLETEGGYLFLDEIGDMPVAVQPVFLHVLEQHTTVPEMGDSNRSAFDFQIISATQRNLNQAVQDGGFRSDLYYRICGVQIDLKPLSLREDCSTLIASIYSLHSKCAAPLDEESLAVLSQATWPGNIRQLLSVIALADLLSDNATPRAQHFVQAIEQQPGMTAISTAYTVNTSTPAPELSPLESAERQTLLVALSNYNWSVSEVAKSLGLSRNTIYRKMGKYALPAKRNIKGSNTDNDT